MLVESDRILEHLPTVSTLQGSSFCSAPENICPESNCNLKASQNLSQEEA